MQWLPRTVFVLCVALSAACQPSARQSPKDGAARFDKPPPAPSPWTDAFEKPALLFADEVVIEGPQGLIDHCALRNELELHDVRAETIAEGFRQETRLKAGVEGEIHAYVDHWEIVAFRRVVVLERVAPCDVRIVASGDVRQVDRATRQEQHGPQLVFEGKIRR